MRLQTTTRHVWQTTLQCSVVLTLAFGPSEVSAQTYALPNDRRIPWSAGSDQWNGGTLPVYRDVTCAGLTAGSGTTDNQPAIQACLDAAPVDTAVAIPAGTYYVNGTISLDLKTRVVLRGAGAGSPYLPNASSGTTTLRLGTNGRVLLSSTRSTNRGTERVIESGYTKGSTTLVMASGHGFVEGDWISVFEDGEAGLTSVTGNIGDCTWCGANNGSDLIQQFVQVKAVNGNSITISRPLYYTYHAGNNPGAKKMTWSSTKVGIEHIKLDGAYADHPAFVTAGDCLFCWVNEIETYHAGTAAKANHVNVTFSHGLEVRDSYFHHGRANGGDRNYGIAFFWWNSDHKVENNILRHHRHSLAFEGGGSGIAILYNYIDDNYTDDLSYLGSARTNHGAHPMFNLYEGNTISHIQADNVWGTSSHIVMFRNWLRGGQAGAGLPALPDWGFYAIDVGPKQHYYSFVGNVLGESSWSGGTLRVTTSGQCATGSSTKIAYRYGCEGTFDAVSGTTSLNHGNYDYISNSVAYWEGGANHQLASSMYYNSKPDFFGGCAWPVFGPDMSPMTRALPAKNRFDLSTSCGVPAAPTAPAAPSNLRIVP